MLGVCIPHRIHRVWGTGNVIQEEEADARIIVNKIIRNMKKGTKEKSPRQGLTSTKDLIMMLLGSCGSPFHRSKQIANI